MSTTNTATMAPAAAPSIALPPTSVLRKGPNPKDSMKSTWRRDPTQWKYAHRALNRLNAFHVNLDQPVPVHEKTDPVPYFNEWSCHVFIIVHALWPIALQQLYTFVVGSPLHPIATFILYTVAMQANAIHEVRLLRRVGHQTGFLDGEKPRDGIPDISVGKVFASLQLTTTIRPIFTIFLAYRKSMSHSLSWWLPIELALYSVVLDLFFYTYHRSCHELDGLWKYHRTHHLTKHPNPLLSSYADSEQEFLEIFMIPLLTYATLKYVFGLPMGFHDCWMCMEYVLFSEAFGHSGLRIFATAPSVASPLLRLTGCELAIEDHDLHHRQGWRQSANYGKQTRVWDRLFGTCRDRLEGKADNIDYVNSVNMPLW